MIDNPPLCENHAGEVWPTRCTACQTLSSEFNAAWRNPSFTAPTTTRKNTK